VDAVISSGLQRAEWYPHLALAGSGCDQRPVSGKAGARTGLLVRLPQPCRYVPCAVKDAPNVNLRVSFNVEYQVRKLAYLSTAQADHIQLMGVSRPARFRLTGNRLNGCLKRIGKLNRDFRASFSQVVLYRLINVAAGSLPERCRFGHYCPLASASIRLRSSSK